MNNGGVVVATAKVRIFKQITTTCYKGLQTLMLLLLPQRYEFSSKSQQGGLEDEQWWSCCCYRKGTNFQANHNKLIMWKMLSIVVVWNNVSIVRLWEFNNILSKADLSRSDSSPISLWKFTFWERNCFVLIFSCLDYCIKRVEVASQSWVVVYKNRGMYETSRFWG